MPKYMSTARPLTYGAYPSRDVPTLVELGTIILPAQKYTSPSGRQVYSFGTIEYSEKVRFDVLDHFDLYPLDLDEEADYLLWRNYDCNPEWFIKELQALPTAQLEEFFSYEGNSPVTWALKRKLGYEK